MVRWPAALLLAALLPLEPVAVKHGPAYAANGDLQYPAGYAEWVFLGAGLDMSYASEAAPSEHTFNAVYANPEAWQGFKQSGVWPEGTMLVLENRGATGAASINKRGQTETAEVTGLEIHVKDSARQKGGWAFYGFEEPGAVKSTGKLIARPANCYACHEQHAASGTTFVQFYPGAFRVAKAKGTLSAEYLKEAGAGK
jgi:hypothetical protein